MNMSLFTSFDGRIGRQNWWLGLIVLCVAQSLIFFVIGMLFGTPVEAEPAMGEFGVSYDLGLAGSLIALVVALPFIWASLCISAKRWHDRGKSAWWILIGLVPVIGGLWALVECGFLKGTDGPNQFGADPLAG
jgi:uncharacterized membrane protein YhaH (DUF805 family)